MFRPVLVLCGFLAAVSPASSADQAPPFPAPSCEMNAPGTLRASDVTLADLDGDGVPEGMWLDGRTLHVTCYNRNPLWTVDLGDVDTAGLTLVADVDGDGAREVGVSTRKGLNLCIAFWGFSAGPAQAIGDTPARAIGDTPTRAIGRALRVISARGGESYGRPDSGLSAYQVADVTGDGKLDCLAAISTGYGWKPRAAICFDLGTGAEHWRYDVGPGVTSIAAADLDGDGTVEVAVGSYGPGNGNEAPDGTDDGHSYIWCLDGPTGKLRWRKDTGDYFTGVQVRVVDLGDGPQVLACTHAAYDFRSDQGRATLLAADGAEQAAFEIGKSIQTIDVRDFDADGADEVLLVDRSGAARILGRGLKPEVDYSVGNTVLAALNFNLGGVGDLDGDGLPDIVAVVSERDPRVTNPRSDMGPKSVTFYHHVRVLVLASDLETVKAELPVAELWETWPGFAASVHDWNGDGAPDLVVQSDKIRVYSLRKKTLDMRYF